MREGARVGVAALLVMMGPLLTPEAAEPQGWVEPSPAPGIGSLVEKTLSEVRVTIDGRVARISVTERFRNPGRRVVQGHYLYPLPGEAVFQGFSLFQGDAELRGEIMDAEQARRIYEEIVRRRADPALIELAGQGLLRARVFPIEPGEERQVTIRYTQVLRRAGDALQLLYAGSVRGPRSEAGPVSVPRPGPSAARRQGGPGIVRTRFEVVAEDGSRFLDPFSPTHALRIRREGGRLSVDVEEELIGRLSLFLPLAGEALGLSLATHRPPGEDGYFMLTLSPGRTSGSVQAKDVTVVLDVSGSMSGEKIVQARAALNGLLNTFGRGDRFRLVSFSNDVRRLSEGWLHATDADLGRAREWVGRLVADGGTNIAGALDEALRLESPSERLPVVIFLTDGLPSVGEQSPERLADRAERRAGRTRVFAFGVGNDVNTHLLDRLGEAGRGSTDYVQPGENVEHAVALLAAKVRHPVLTDVEIGDVPVRWSEIYPVRIPDLFSGQELILFGRYTGEGSGRVAVRGSRAGLDEVFETEAVFPRSSEANPYLPKLWASRKLGHLMRQIWTEGESVSLEDEIRSLALRYGLPSPYTAYLVQESDVVAGGGGGAMRGRLQKVMPATALAAPRRQSPSSASGAVAVRRAEEARGLRSAASMDELDVIEAEIAGSLADGPAGDRRVLAGRLFRLHDGVWSDAGHGDETEVVHIRAYSPVYFRLLAELPELVPILREVDAVLVAGEAVSVQIGEDGKDQMDDRLMEDLVARFRGTVAKR